MGERENSHPHFIPEKSPEYGDTIDWHRRLHVKRPVVFGENSLREYKKSEAAMNVDRLLGKDSLALKPFESERGRLRLYTDPERLGKYDFVRNRAVFFLESMEQNPDVYQQIMELNEGQPMNVESLTRLLDGDLISSELFAQMLHAHSERMAKEKKDFETECVGAMEDFVHACEKLIEAGDLPLSLNELYMRLNEVDVVLEDPMGTSMGEMGSYSLWSVRTFANLPSSVRKAALFHEFTHAVSGRLVKKAHHYDRAVETRIGINLKTKSPTDLSFTWLNEAITEHIASKLLGNQDVIAYHEEVGVLRELIGVGIPEKMFLAAMFETYDPDRPGKKYPAWHELVKKIQEVKGKAFLRTQEEFFKKED